MAEEIIKVKVPDLPLATTLDGFFAFGVDGSNRSVKVPILMLQGNKGIDGKSLEFTWSGTKLGVRVAGTTTWNYVELRGANGAPFTYDMFTQAQLEALKVKGDPGNSGNSLEFNWNGTKLGIRVAGTTTYTYVELRGADGADAYEVAVEEGFTGTREEWLQSLQGGQTDNWIKNW